MTEQPPRKLGRVKWFNKTSGCGFITVDDEKDIFVHHSKIKPNTVNYRYLVEGEYCEF